MEKTKTTPSATSGPYTPHLQPFLKTQRLKLRPLQEADAQGSYVDWLNNADVCFGNSHHVYPYTQEQALDYIRQARTTREAVILAIVTQATPHHIGNVALQRIHPIHRCAELTLLLGEQTHWGQGYGKEAAQAIVEHGFNTLNLHRIECQTLAFNHGMQKVATDLGMTQEGIRQKAMFKSGKYHDVFQYGLLKETYLNPRTPHGHS